MLNYAPYLGRARVISRPAPAPVSLGAMADAEGSALGIAIPSILVAASVAASAYHGYKRNNSTGWAIWWGLMGALFPIITPAIAVAQGFGKRA